MVLSYAQPKSSMREILPPDVLNKMLGRPKVSRRKEAEKSPNLTKLKRSFNQCCKQYGGEEHNKRTRKSSISRNLKSPSASQLSGSR